MYISHSYQTTNLSQSFHPEGQNNCGPVFTFRQMTIQLWISFRTKIEQRFFILLLSGLIYSVALVFMCQVMDRECLLIVGLWYQVKLDRQNFLLIVVKMSSEKIEPCAQWPNAELNLCSLSQCFAVEYQTCRAYLANNPMPWFIIPDEIGPIKVCKWYFKSYWFSVTCVSKSK